MPGSVMVGQTISHYQILRKLGGGGMGVVYAAEDLHLHRQVALKFLSPRLADAPHALARFQREALAASACNHPNICTIHDIDRHDGAPFIVMELIDGVSLRDQLSQAPMPVATLLTLGIQIADALEAAHGAGIVHRDLTPSNIFITRRGDAKVLDFGIAKLFAEQWSESETHAAAPTQDVPLTAHGHVLGTPGYASPEQTLGLEVDARTDLFSLGVILYQMATGRRPFDGHTPGLVSDAVVHAAPAPPISLNAQVPSELAAVIEKALEKDRALRYQSAADLKADLRRVKRNFEHRAGDTPSGDRPSWTTPSRSGAIVTAGTPARRTAPLTMTQPFPWSRRRRIATYLVIGLVAVAATWLLVGSLRGTAGLPETVSRSVTGGPENDTDPAVSPDGSRIAYVTDRKGVQSIWMVDAQGGGRPWKTGAAAYRHPAWSPDGRLLFFESDANGQSGVYQAESLNPDATTFVIGNAREPAVSPDGTRLAFLRAGGSGNDLRVAVAPIADIRAVTIVSKDGEGRWDHLDPAWSPDGREICYAAWDGLWIVPADGGRGRQLTRSDSTDTQPVWSQSGSIYFSSKRRGLWQLWRVPAGGGTPEPVTVGLGTERAPTLSPSGRLLAYSTASDNFELLIRDLVTGEDHPVGGGDQQVLPTFAPDGRAVYFNMTSGNRQGIWRQAVAEGLPVGAGQPLLPAPSVTALPSKASQPACAPDGSRVAFLRLQLVAGGADSRRGWLASAAHLLGITRRASVGERWMRSIWTVPAAGGMPVPFTSSREVDEYNPSWSPDGTRLAFVRDRGSEQHVYIQPIENGEPRGNPARLTAGPGREMAPTWSPDGESIAFIRSDLGEVAVAPVDRRAAPNVLTSGAGALALRWKKPGVLFVSGYWGGGMVSLRAIDPATGRPLSQMAPIDLGRDPVLAVFDVSTDGRYLVMARASGKYGRIGVLEATSGRF